MIDREAWDDYSKQRETMHADFRRLLDSASTEAEKEASWTLHSTALKQLREKYQITAEAFTRQTEYQVSVFQESDDPEGYLGLSSWSLTVAYRGRDLWAVTDRINCLSRSGSWDYEMRPSEREDGWLAEHRFPLEEALALAQAAAPSVSINGRSAAELKIELSMKGRL